MSVRLIFLSSIILLSAISGSAQTLTIRQYIDSFKNIAMKEMKDYKIPASITLAQGLLESGSGNSRLAKEGNNHFGIKCKKDWTGCTILEDDDALQECFRCYTNPEESYKDHSRFLSGNQRYAALFSLQVTDYKGWASGLLSAGYATNKKYADLLITTIEKNKLATFDTMVVNGYDPFNKQVPANIEIVSNHVPSTVVQPNQTVETIAEANQRTEKRLAKYNDLQYHQQIEPGDVLYLKPKKRKASIATHQVEEGESMWEISQKYAIKISSLYKKNLMEPGTEPKPGSVLQLRQKAQTMPDTGRIIPAVIKPDTLDTYHVVAAGETLYSISRLYQVSVESIMKINGLQSTQLMTGQRLKLKSDNSNSNSNTAEASSSITKHAVSAGETLYAISRLYKVSVSDIKTWNKLSSDSLYVGQVLEIRTR